MQKSLQSVLIALVLSLICGFAVESVLINRSDFEVNDIFSRSEIVNNNISKIREVSETEVRRDRKGYYELGENIPIEIERVVTWTVYDKVGRVVSRIDSSTASDHTNLQVKVQSYGYENNVLTTYDAKEWYESPKDTGKNVRITLIEHFTKNSSFSYLRTEREESGEWNVQIDSTVFNLDGQNRMVYTYNSVGDSFVEEFTYDSKARLKYRRLTMKQFWSPPWELESTSYKYNADGSRFVIDSVWRNNPDMNQARKNAGESRAPDYKWKVLAASGNTGTFDRLENRKEETFDCNNHLVLSQRWAQPSLMWEDYSWSYNEKGQLVRKTEYRGDRPGDRGVYGDPCTDTIWYEYIGGWLSEERSHHYCNGIYSGGIEVFEMDGMPLDPNRVEKSKYTGTLVGVVETVTIFKHGQGVDYRSNDARGLPIERRLRNNNNELTITTYSYFTW